EIPAVGLAFAGESGFQILFRLGTFERSHSILLVPSRSESTGTARTLRRQRKIEVQRAGEKDADGAEPGCVPSRTHHISSMGNGRRVNIFWNDSKLGPTTRWFRAGG